MKTWWPSPRVWTGAVVALALVAAVLGALARTVIFNLTPEDSTRSVQRFAAGAPEVEVDPRQPWARIPRILPGPADSWAGGSAHALRLPLGQRPVRRLVLYLHFAQEWPDVAPIRLTVAVNDTVVTTVGAQPGTGLPSPDTGWGVRSRRKIRIPETALGDGTNVRLLIINDSGSSILWERIRLVEGYPTLAWAHLGRRRQLPPESAAFLAASLGTLLVWSLGSATGESWSRRALRATGPVVALILCGVASRMPDASPFFAGIPSWLWLAAPWPLLLFRSRAPGPGSPHIAPDTIGSLVGNETEPPVRTFPNVARAKTIILNTTVSLIALAGSLLIAEFALRVAFRDVKSAGDARTYFHTPAPTDETNSFGFREREFSLRKPENTYRIALIGDSFTRGGPLIARVSNRLEKYLNARGRPDLTYEVLNFGKTGADTVDHVRILTRPVLNTDPDFVLLQWFVNDFENHDHSERPNPLRLLPSATLHRTLLRSSALYPLIDTQWRHLQETVGLTESHPAYMYRRFGDPEGSQSTFAMRQLRNFIGECKERNRALGIVMFPRVGPDLARAYAYGYLHDRVLEVCHQEKITCVDLRSTFAQYHDYKKLWASLLDGHPSPLANQLATERLIDAFGQIWLGAHLKGQNH